MHQLSILIQVIELLLIPYFIALAIIVIPNCAIYFFLNMIKKSQKCNLYKFDFLIFILPEVLLIASGYLASNYLQINKTYTLANAAFEPILLGMVISVIFACRLILSKFNKNINERTISLISLMICCVVAALMTFFIPTLPE